ncbi:CDP-alcohol phosphatidyltransferase family protein [Methylomonas sp. MO1]|uniref:CDP-alcohol phosphatidyltransferase family protein n=1 Tax=unclassified Methylomonas TaxID=2608980 RepID=UPI00047BF341|nr:MULTISPECIES: CDP-alcohol phosphatidyltransferase family protein [unclassified Methylomonas]MDT4292025.1 CDP-alcohol phosphatidyltransferase family protein [Methylomonas sp. MO1]
MQATENTALNLLQHEVRTIAILGVGVLLIGFGFFGLEENWMLAGQWMILASLIWAYVCRCVWQRLALNRAKAEAPLYVTLGWGNRITILRGGCIALTGGFLFMPQTLTATMWLPALCYTLAAILDRLDGFAARRSGQVSLLGNELDISFDALGLVIAPLLAIGLGKLQFSYLLLSAAYYVYRWGLQRRCLGGLPLHPLPENPLRRTLAGFQMAFVAVALWPLLDPELSVIAGIAFMLPVLFGFATDWWVVCGGLTPLAYGRLAEWSEQYFQPGLRVLLALLLFLLIADANDPAGNVTAYGLLLVASLVVLGLAGRLGALSVLIWFGWHYPPASHPVGSYLVIFTASWILLLGTGHYSLWSWGDAWIQRYDGA